LLKKQNFALRRKVLPGKDEKSDKDANRICYNV
jgi:hypothetical protein